MLPSIYYLCVHKLRVWQCGQCPREVAAAHRGRNAQYIAKQGPDGRFRVRRKSYDQRNPGYVLAIGVGTPSRALRDELGEQGIDRAKARCLPGTTQPSQDPAQSMAVERAKHTIDEAAVIMLARHLLAHQPQAGQ